MLSKQISNLNSSSNKPKILSLFSGCGGLDLGFHQAGCETVWANDFSHWACESFRKNIGDVIVEGDIEQINPNDPTIPDCDIILGGFPCQDFSMIWKQPGLEGERGNLYKSFLRFVNAKKPKVFVAENVKGGNFTDIPKDHPLYVKGMISHVYRRMHRNEPSKTIIAAGGGGTWGYHFPEPRAFTNRERARLQSFPDDFEFVGSTTEVRRQIGNAVPPQGVVELAKSILPIFSDNYEKVDLHEKLVEEKEILFHDRLSKIRGGKQ